MNKGVRLASGDILACLNADDFYSPDTFSKVIRAFREYPEAMIIHGNLRVNGRELRPPAPPASFGGARIFHPASFIRRELFEKLGPFDSTYKICADLNFFLKAKKIRRCVPSSGHRFYKLRTGRRQPETPPPDGAGSPKRPA